MRLRDRIAIAASAAAVGLAVLGVGGALRWVQAGVAVLVAVALGANFLSRRRIERFSPLIVALAIAVIATAIQLIPVPDAIVSALNPAGASLREQGTALADVGYWPSVSMDAPGTLSALAFFLVLFGVATVALRFAASERGRYGVLATIASVCGLSAVIAGAHELVGASSLYGLYDPSQATPLVLGPMLNENHLAGLMALGMVVSLGLFAETKQRSWVRVAWVLIAIACFVVAVATRSRGGVLALVAGTAVTVLVLLAQRLRLARRGKLARRERFLVSSLPLAILAVCAVVLVIYASASGVAEQLSSTSLAEIQEPTSKFAAWRSAGELVRESPWVGQGRGAFEPVFTRIHPASALATFSHVENEYIQAVVEWGIPTALALVLVFGWVGFVAIRRWRDGPLAAAAIGGLVVIAVQSNVDFGIELLGLAVPATAVAATLLYVPVREASARGLHRIRARRIVQLVTLGGAAVVLLLPITTSVGEDHESMVAERYALPELRAAIERHPLDYLAYARVADALIQQRDPNGVRFLNHAMQLHPTHAGLHTIAARLLHATGRDAQAAVEYEAAMRARPDPTPLIREVVGSFGTVEHIVAAIPAEHARVELVVRVLEQLERRDVATAWLMRVLEHRPQDATVCDLLYAQAVTGGDLKAAEASGRHCLKVNPSHKRQLALARVLFQQGSYAETIQQLRDVGSWRGRIDELATAWLMLCDSHEALQQWDAARQCLRRLDGQSLLGQRRDEITRRLDRIEKTRVKLELDATGASGGGLMPKILR